MWDNIAIGALGAVVLIDIRRIEDSFGPIDYFETRQIPFIVALNWFPGSPEVAINEVRDVLALDPSIPIGFTNALKKERVQATLIALVEYLMRRVMLAGPLRTGRLAGTAGPDRP